MSERLRKPLVELMQDMNIRESFTWLYEYLIRVPILKSELEHFERTFSQPLSQEKVPHGLGFTPKDIILTYVSPDSTTVSFQYDQFDGTNLVITTNAACTIRFMAGRYVNEF